MIILRQCEKLTRLKRHDKAFKTAAVMSFYISIADALVLVRP
ncbi:hypothetical protein SeseC_01402 [Streptococcus equi subsp. zooepidemicus ATCC 35246]|nr:hypothetical protein SeseC_01402 [Streptococcus equi subsp. zooepidemicus ATCC 35246]